MESKLLILDEKTICELAIASFESSWFDGFYIPQGNSKKIRRVEVENCIYLLSDSACKDSKLLFIKIEEDKLFSGVEDKKKKNVLHRILVIGMNKFGYSVTPGKGWRKYAGKNYTSISSGCKKNNIDARILFDKNPCGTQHIYAFDYNFDPKSYEEYDIDEDLFIKGFDSYEKALSVKVNHKEPVQEKNYGITLTESIEDYYGAKYSVEHWYDNILTAEQRTFVDKAYDAPVRLKGAAGTGKTLALATKLLRDAYKFEDKDERKNLLFITHSTVNSQLVLDIIHSMDNLSLWSNFKHVNLNVISLYDLAQNLLNYNLKNLRPLSTDGREGRQLQFELFSSILENILKDIVFVKGILDKCSERFKNYILDAEPSKRRRFLLDVLNEFACILEAENIYIGSPLSEKYLSGPRESWLMELESENERRVILELHELYKKELKGMDVLSMDQMIADLNRYLLSHEWNHIRKDVGYDAIFVDELHCFTKPERMIFHELFKRDDSYCSDKLPLFMAYDINQSTDDRFLYSISPNNASSLLRSTKVGATNLVELTKVFRYTPEISKFLSHIDGAFPALDLASEWCTSTKLENSQKEGETPKLKVFESNKDLVDQIFKEASNLAARNPETSVAVLCVNTERYDFYANTLGRIKGKFVKLSSRDEIVRPQKSKGKCIFSMPDYVAGLQFDVVFLIHIDKNELDEDFPHSGQYRRFISQIYLGSSRARKRLILASSLERRGPSSVLDGALADSSLVQE
ncbi:UvrD-helicase domain-containing protein [Vibrio vulnificus]